MKVSNPSQHKPSLEKFSIIENNMHYWWASWYAKILGYSSIRTLLPSITKAKKVCIQLGISIEENFINDVNNSKKDIKLTKFACFLISLQADNKKPIVKRARSYFLNELEEINIMLDSQDYLNRNIGREEIKNLNKKLSSAAKKAHVKDFQYFINEGYIGFYNQTMQELRKSRGIGENENILDFAGLTEISANIFRLSLTVDRLNKLKNPTENEAAREHWKIGLQLRSLIKENTGSYPENLPIHEDLHILQARLKEAQLQLNEDIGKIGAQD